MCAQCAETTQTRFRCAKGFCARLENFFPQAISSYLHQTLSAFRLLCVQIYDQCFFLPLLLLPLLLATSRMRNFARLGRKSCGQCLTFVFGLPASGEPVSGMCVCVWVSTPTYVVCVCVCGVGVSHCVCVCCVRVNLHCSRAALLSPVAAATDSRRHLVLIYGTFCWRFFFSRLLSVFFAYFTSYLFCCPLPKGMSVSLSLHPLLSLSQVAVTAQLIWHLPFDIPFAATPLARLSTCHFSPPIDALLCP